MDETSQVGRARDLAISQRLAREAQRREADYRAGKIVPYPARITTALDIHGMNGPEVDAACLAEEPAVDQWEAGEAVPTWEQLSALARLTDFPVAFFLRPVDVAFGPMWLCGEGGCERYTPPEPVPPYRPLAPVVDLRPAPVSAVLGPSS